MPLYFPGKLPVIIRPRTGEMENLLLKYTLKGFAKYTLITLVVSLSAVMSISDRLIRAAGAH